MLGTTQAADGEGGGHGGGSVDGNSGRQGPADGTPAKRTGQASLERDVLERLVKSNARAYVSQAQVSNAMQEVLRDRDNHVVGGDTGTAAVVAAAEAAAVAAKGGDGSARGFFVAGGGGRGAKHRKKRKPNSRAEGMQEDEDDENEEPDLWILKRKREEVLSLIRCGGVARAPRKFRRHGHNAACHASHSVALRAHPLRHQPGLFWVADAVTVTFFYTFPKGLIFPLYISRFTFQLNS